MSAIWYPEIVQGGMGVFISNWIMARAVSMHGQLGTVSGVTLERVLVAILQRGDPGGHVRRALATFPFPHIAKSVIDAYFVEGGVQTKRFKNAPVFTIDPSPLLIATVICANYAFVWLAKEGHQKPVSINYLEKIQMPHIYAITGAMLANIDYITMGAGIALQIPSVINGVLGGTQLTYNLPVVGQTIKNCVMSFNPSVFFGAKLPEMQKPFFLPIISSNLLARIFMEKLPEGTVHGFVVEESTAGGHNAPPRTIVTDADGHKHKVYGQKDEVDYSALAKLGLPFWVGGGNKKLSWARSIGAKGIQSGSIFALSEASGMNPDLRREARKLGYNGQLQIRTDMQISPTGFPFKVACLEKTVADKVVLDNRQSVCNHGVLVTLYEKPDGTIGYRCSSEPRESYLAKGGKENTEGCGCVCNGLLSSCDKNSNPDEPALVTLGDDCDFLHDLMKDESASYSIADAIKYLLGR